MKKLWNQWLLDNIGLKKLIRMVRFTIFITILSLSQAFAVDTYSQQTKLTLDMRNARVEDVIDNIEKQSEFFFMYNKNMVDVDRKVDMVVEGQVISQVLDKLFGSTDITYSIRDRQILLINSKIISASEENSGQQQKMISGKVTDISGASLPGVSVVIKGTTTGIITDSNGKFALSGVTPGATLVFSFVGMKVQEIKISDQTSVNVKLEEMNIGVEEVVVTALGIKREEKALGYAVQKVAGESLQKVSGTDVTTSLTGKVAGLLVKNSSDFGAAPVMTIRGENPLLVIDGVAYQNKTLSDISAEDIESMSVLKGATASALYGYRGASGAILITTKNGSTSAGGITVDFATNTMFTAGFLAIPEKQSVYGRGGNNTYDKNNTSSWGTTMDGKSELQWDPFLMTDKESPYLPVGKDNFANFLQQGYVSNNNLNIGYKGNVASVRSSFNWTQNKGQYPNSMLNKYTYTFGGDVNLEKFKFDLFFKNSLVNC